MASSSGEAICSTGHLRDEIGNKATRMTICCPISRPIVRPFRPECDEQKSERADEFLKNEKNKIKKCRKSKEDKSRGVF
jgi:hypothetical protein